MVRPYSKVTVVAAPLALTVPLTVAVVAATALAEPVDTEGADAAQAAVVKVRSPPLTAAPTPLSPLARKWYRVLQVRLATATLTAAPVAPADSGLCAAVAELP